MRAARKSDDAPKRAAPGDVLSAPSIGGEVRQLRKARQMTLKALSEASGLSLSHLSAIERGTSKPSLGAIEAIAEALAIAPDWFFARRCGSGPLERAHVVRVHQRRNLNALYASSEQDLGYTDSLLSSSIGGRFYMGIAHYAPGAERVDETMLSFEGEQHGLLIEGELELRLGDEGITLRAGDSYSHDARIPHHARNCTDRPAVLVWAVSPVVFPMDVTHGAGRRGRLDPQRVKRPS